MKPTLVTDRGAGKSFPRPPVTASPDVRRHRPQRRDQVGTAFVVPFIVMFLLTMAVPLGYAVYSSFYRTTLFGSSFGVSNYVATFSSGEFWGGVERVAIFAAVQVPLTLALAFLFAALFDLRAVRFSSFFRVVLFLPYTVPTVVSAIMWSFLLEPQFGVYTRFTGINFFSSDLVLPTIIVIVIWEVMGYNMLIFYTALKSVPGEIVEAAVLDGASLWGVIFRVKLPMVRGATVMLIFLNLIGALQLFTEPSIIAGFAPYAISFGFTPVIYIYNTAIGKVQPDLAAAAAVIFALVITIVSVGSLLAARRPRGAAG